LFCFVLFCFVLFCFVLTKFWAVVFSEAQGMKVKSVEYFQVVAKEYETVVSHPSGWEKAVSIILDTVDDTHYFCD
jgi:hypothetical protein